MLKHDADDFAESNEATFVHWLKRHLPPDMCNGLGWCEGMRWMSLVKMTEEDLKLSD